MTFFWISFWCKGHLIQMNLEWLMKAISDQFDKKSDENSLIVEVRSPTKMNSQEVEILAKDTYEKRINEFKG